MHFIQMAQSHSEILIEITNVEIVKLLLVKAKAKAKAKKKNNKNL